MGFARKTMGVDFKNHYEPELQARKPEQKETIERLKKEVNKAEKSLPCNRPDREGEAISYHLQCALNLDPNEKTA